MHLFKMIRNTPTIKRSYGLSFYWILFVVLHCGKRKNILAFFSYIFYSLINDFIQQTSFITLILTLNSNFDWKMWIPREFLVLNCRKWTQPETNVCKFSSGIKNTLFQIKLTGIFQWWFKYLLAEKDLQYRKSSRKLI